MAIELSINENLIKVRDDDKPLKFTRNEACVDGDTQFQCSDQEVPSWSTNGSFTITELRSRVEPWLTSLFQSEHLSLLAGSGLTNAIQFEATNNSNNGMAFPTLTTKYAAQIKAAAERSATQNNRCAANIEDALRIMTALLHGLEIQCMNQDYIELEVELKKTLDEFTKSIITNERKIITAENEKRSAAFEKLVMFLMSFASRTGTRDRLNIFTTNYDRVIELGAELAGIHLLDRFVGSLAPIFRSSRLDIDMHYNPPGIRGEPRYLEGVARFTKLHGSVDWVDAQGEIRKIGLPFGALDIVPFLESPGKNADATNVMIYPNASKDRETAEYPYVELFRDLASALCRPNSTLVTYGYGFGDAHINRIIRDMLTIPSTHLVIISFDDAGGRILKNYDLMGHISQISLLIGRDVGAIEPLTNHLLPRPSIDQATIRMANLLSQRFSDQPSKNVASSISSVCDEVQN